jgi:ATP-dependent DNA helicase RecQ
MRRLTNIGDLAGSLNDRMLQRESREIARLNQVLELAAHDGCQVSRLGEHFGEPLAKLCGHCSWCLNGRRPAQLLPRRAANIDEGVWQEALRLRKQQPDPLGDSRAFARFLCGLTSPKLWRGKFTSLSLFGALGQVPFPLVLERSRQ